MSQPVEIPISPRRTPNGEESVIADAAIVPRADPTEMEEGLHLFQDRRPNPNSLTPEKATIHLVKSMLGTGLLSLPLAFKHAGLYLGLILVFVISGICLYCMRQVVYCAHYICARNGREMIDYANIMRGAIEAGPSWLNRRGYFFKQLVNVNMFIAQLGFCCVYFVFMADNAQDFFLKVAGIDLPKSVWMAILLIPIMIVCLIRNLNYLAPFSNAANFFYLLAVAIITYYFITNLKSTSEVAKVGEISNLPLFFGTVMFAFEGVCVIMPLENRMERPQQFIQWNGVLNFSCAVVLTVFATVGFYGYLAVGDSVHDTVTLDLPEEPFYQIIKIIFVGCVMVSYPIQFYVPMERVEKWITRKIVAEKQIRYIYMVRVGGVFLTLCVAELIPHLALFISLIGAFSGASLALIIPPFIDLLCAYAQRRLTVGVWAKDIFLVCFGLLGFLTGTYAALADIAKTFSG
ncbi:hypothetical protein L596_025084 [Steinernema carpocapsae]|uniref:Amino acid transporter transmembrane domain-containing protein n=1 Tax=Steinernema carpocapsae TaxID=34508 RepID=A0A4U5M6S1_STECR|nr:hypothetical protein L596_025084 [Steinernema carpocapsae]